jgi:hypothetical protein
MGRKTHQRSRREEKGEVRRDKSAKVKVLRKVGSKWISNYSPEVKVGSKKITQQGSKC